MANGVTFKIKNDHTNEVIHQKDVLVQTALEMIGLQAEKYAVLYISGDSGHPKRVDTGNLRDSINHRVVKEEEAVYVGTNVEYALAVHEGTIRMAPNRYLRDAATDHTDEYKKMAEDCLNG